MYYILIIAIAFYLTIILTPITIKYCIERSILDYPGGRKVHKKAVPRIGGLAMYISFIIAEIVGFSIYHNLLSELATELIGINLALAVLIAGGIIDDIKQLKPEQKLFFQLLAAAITVAFGYQVRLLTIPFWGTVGLGSWGIPITMIWIVGLINAMNFLDGMDGLAAGVGFIISATFFASGLIFETEFPIIVACGLMGVTAGFLKYNYPPASIFMGDSGSMMLGYLFAVISVIWPKSIATITMIVPIAALGVPLIESSITVIRRIFMRQSIYKADSLHIFHILRFLGLSETAILWLFYLISMLFSFVVIAILMPDRGLITALAAIFILIVFILLLKSSRKLY